MNFGGPVWHCSVRHPIPERARELAHAELEGVGDATAGEWEERYQSFHLRRRLSASEAEQIGPVLDLRGTSEAWQRFKALPAVVRAITGGQPL